MIASVIDCSYGVTDMRYSELVQAIKSNTLADLENLLAEKCIKLLSGSTRDAYMFDTHVVKVNNYSQDENSKEYKNYCASKVGLLNIPIVQTRLYKTTDDKNVLIQERLLKMVDCYTYSPELYTSYLESQEIRDIEDQLLASGVHSDAFNDGAHMGYNKRNQVVLYDISRY